MITNAAAHDQPPTLLPIYPGPDSEYPFGGTRYLRMGEQSMRGDQVGIAS